MQMEILNLEKDLFKKEKISDQMWLNQIIDDHFIECGKSGKIFNKEITVKAFNNFDEDRNIIIYNYSYNQIDKNTYLVHYFTKQENNIYYRTSIWIKKENLKLLFHQATKYNENIKLIEF